MNRIYNRNRIKTKTGKKPDPITNTRLTSPAVVVGSSKSSHLPDGADFKEARGKASDGCGCQHHTEIHRLTNELYQLHGKHKDLINENTGLKNQNSELNSEIKTLRIQLKNKDVSSNLMNINRSRWIT